MHFLILGSLELRASERRIHITAPKQRAALAGLLLEANNEVPISRLTRFVWDDDPPVTAQTTLQSYVYRLRQTLRPLPADLRTAGDRYLLSVSPSEIDLWHFRERVKRSYWHAQYGRPADTVRELRRALDLWRGEALSWAPGEYIQQEARLLEAERIAAYEELFTTEIVLGGHRQIVPELQKVVSEYPFHESLRALLMLALYASGRQVEALQHFEQIRLRLRDDLGIAPGHELRELHQSILEQLPVEKIDVPRPTSWNGPTIILR